MKDQFTAKLAMLAKNIDENRKNLNEDTLQRNKAHDAFLGRVNDH